MKKLYWIDDKQSHASHQMPQGASQKKLEDGLGVNLEVKELSSFSEFENLMSQMNPADTYGVLMDYKLVKVRTNNATEYGTTWAAHLRSSDPSIPIIGLSVEKESSIPKFRMENFLAFFNRKKLLNADSSIGQLKALFEDYRKIWNRYKQKTTETGLGMLMDLLVPPVQAQDLLRIAIPTQFRVKWDDETTHAVARWIWHELQGRAGFLIDDLEAATYLGLTKEAFMKFENKHFKAARYKGILACEDRPRWWASQMREVAEKVLGESIIGPVAHSRDELLRAFRVPRDRQNSMKSQPHGRKKDSVIPECVVFPDGASKNENLLEDRVPALLRDTVIDEVDANPPLGFQAIRHFKLDAQS